MTNHTIDPTSTMIESQPRKVRALLPPSVKTSVTMPSTIDPTSAATGFEKYGGEYLVRGGETETVEGDWQPKRLVVVRFPTRDDARAFLSDPGYREVATIRHAATVTNMVLVDGFETS